jgi:hypothetical protein
MTMAHVFNPRKQLGKLTIICVRLELKIIFRVGSVEVEIHPASLGQVQVEQSRLVLATIAFFGITAPGAEPGCVPRNRGCFEVWNLASWFHVVHRQRVCNHERRHICTVHRDRIKYEWISAANYRLQFSFIGSYWPNWVFSHFLSNVISMSIKKKNKHESYSINAMK